MKIEKLGSDVFKVTISEPTKTKHKVTVTDNHHKRLTNGRVTKESLLEFSFKFLLDREPNTSILSSFHINVIQNYFGEYEAEVKSWCDRLCIFDRRLAPASPRVMFKLV